MLANHAFWQVRRSTFATRLTLEVADEHGVSVDDCLAGTGLRASDLDDASAEIEVDQELTVVRNVLATLGRPPDLARQIGQRVNLGSLGILGFAILSSPTVRHAITVAMRYAALTPTFLNLAMKEHDGWVTLTADAGDAPPDLRDFFLERDVAAFGAVIPLFVEHLAEVHLELQLPPERGLPLIQGLPLSSVRFDCEQTQVRLPSSALDAPLVNADEHTARATEQLCRDLLDQRSQRHGVAEQVRARLLQDMSTTPSMSEVAQALGVEPRTLHRHLKGEGTSFRELRDQIRETMAVELLGTLGLTVEEVARRLGYAETANFTHAFKRWRGVPPSDYRRR